MANKFFWSISGITVKSFFLILLLLRFRILWMRLSLNFDLLVFELTSWTIIVIIVISIIIIIIFILNLLFFILRFVMFYLWLDDLSWFFIFLLLWGWLFFCGSFLFRLRIFDQMFFVDKSLSKFRYRLLSLFQLPFQLVIFSLETATLITS